MRSSKLTKEVFENQTFDRRLNDTSFRWDTPDPESTQRHWNQIMGFGASARSESGANRENGLVGGFADDFRGLLNELPTVDRVPTSKMAEETTYFRQDPFVKRILEQERNPDNF